MTTRRTRRFIIISAIRATRVPAQGVPLAIPGSNFPMTMIAAYETDPKINFGGTGLDRGFFPGYSRYPCVSPDGKYALAFSTQGGISTVWDLSTLKRIRYPQVRVGEKYYDLGETNQLRWDYSQPTKHVLVAVIDNLGSSTRTSTIRPTRGFFRTAHDVSSDDHQGSSERFIRSDATYKCLYDLRSASRPVKWPVGVNLTSPTFQNRADERCRTPELQLLLNLDAADPIGPTHARPEPQHGQKLVFDSRQPLRFYQTTTRRYVTYSR